jgi:DNA-binding transcriptional MerR regulator
VKETLSGLPEIPNKKYFRIGEVSRLLGVDPHVLRFWETEFTDIKPYRAKSKQRLYQQKDIVSLFRIKSLLHDQGYTIAGARRLLGTEHGEKMANSPTPSNSMVDDGQCRQLDEIKQELNSIRKLLDE